MTMLDIQAREGYADVGDQRLHYVEAGEGPLVVLLHGFPEFWYGWREQIQPLAAAGSGSSHPTPAATTCRRSRMASMPTTSASSPPTSAI
jgi:pimeloyl-ACP methyl ester carboxylesterase